MPEIAIATPFDSEEIKDIACAEFRKRLNALSPLSGSKEYASFSLDFNVKIRLIRVGEQPMEGRETLAWGKVELPSAADLDAVAGEQAVAEATGKFESGDPNDERIARDMPLTVETGPAGNRSRKKIRVKA